MEPVSSLSLMYSHRLPLGKCEAILIQSHPFSHIQQRLSCVWDCIVIVDVSVIYTLNGCFSLVNAKTQK